MSSSRFDRGAVLISNQGTNPMNDENTPDKSDGSLGRLAMGTRLLIRYGRDSQEIEIIANRGDRYAVKMIGANPWREIMTEEELLRRDAVVLAIASPKKPSWWRRLLGIGNAEVSDGGPLTHESPAAQSRRSLH
jgi:hypothetical protein